MVHRNIGHPCHTDTGYSSTYIRKPTLPPTPPGLLNHTFSCRAAHTYIRPSRDCCPILHHRHSSNAGVHPVLRPGGTQPYKANVKILGLRSAVMLCCAGGWLCKVGKMCLVRFWLLFASALGHPFLRALVCEGCARARAPLVRIGRSGVLLLAALPDGFGGVCVCGCLPLRVGRQAGGGGRRGETTLAHYRSAW